MSNLILDDTPRLLSVTESSVLHCILKMFRAYGDEAVTSLQVWEVADSLNQFCPLAGLVPVPGVPPPKILVPAVLNKLVHEVFCAVVLPPVLVLVNCMEPP